MASNVTLAPHLQHALELMSRDMAVAPDALVNQAVFAWLRINGYVVAGSAAPGPAQVAPAEVAAPAVVDEVVDEPAVPTGSSAARLAEIAADLEALTGPAPEEKTPDEPVAPEENDGVAAAEEPAEDEPAAQDEAPADQAAAPAADEDPFADNDAPAAAEEPPAEDQAALDGNTGETDVEQPPEDSTVVLRSVPIALYLEREGEDPIRVDVERFIIGRGPHCDLVIDSPRVSREHVVLTRSGIRYFLEDLNSSNGTWFNGDKVTKRELESGDVISLGNEAVRFILRGT